MFINLKGSILVLLRDIVVLKCIVTCQILWNILSPNNDVREKMVVLLEYLMRTAIRLLNLTKYWTRSMYKTLIMAKTVTICMEVKTIIIRTTIYLLIEPLVRMRQSSMTWLWITMYENIYILLRSTPSIATCLFQFVVTSRVYILELPYQIIKNTKKHIYTAVENMTR